MWKLWKPPICIVYLSVDFFHYNGNDFRRSSYLLHS